MPDLIATGIIPAIFCLAVGYWAVTAFGRWLDRCDVEQQQNLAVGIADERRNTEDEPTEEIVDEDQFDDAPTLREASIPMPADMLPVRYSSRIQVIYGLGTVHSGCLMARRDAAVDHICRECGGAFGAKVGATP